MVGSPKLYLIGSLRNPLIPDLGNQIRELGYDVFDDWHAAGPEADDEWRRYEKERGRSYMDALGGYAARHVFDFDRHHLDEAQVGVLVLPAGKSGHLELGYLIGKGVPSLILLDKDYDRWDVMYRFASGVYDDPADLLVALEGNMRGTWVL